MKLINLQNIIFYTIFARKKKEYVWNDLKSFKLKKKERVENEIKFLLLLKIEKKKTRLAIVGSTFITIP